MRAPDGQPSGRADRRGAGARDVEDSTSGTRSSSRIRSNSPIVSFAVWASPQWTTPARMAETVDAYKRLIDAGTIKTRLYVMLRGTSPLN